MRLGKATSLISTEIVAAFLFLSLLAVCLTGRPAHRPDFSFLTEQRQRGRRQQAFLFIGGWPSALSCAMYVHETVSIDVKHAPSQEPYRDAATGNGDRPAGMPGLRRPTQRSRYSGLHLASWGPNLQFGVVLGLIRPSPSRPASSWCRLLGLERPGELMQIPTIETQGRRQSRRHSASGLS